MTVQQLIDELMKVSDKSLTVKMRFIELDDRDGELASIRYVREFAYYNASTNAKTDKQVELS